MDPIKSPSLQECLKVPGNAMQMPVPLLLHLFLSAYLVLLQAYCRTAYCRKRDLADEEMYLRKYNIIDVILKKHFPDAPEALLDKLAADLCDETES